MPPRPQHLRVRKGSMSMKNFVRFVLLVTALAVITQSASAHFKLLEPASWLVESDRGDPQKAGPCGGSNTDWGKPSYAVSKVTGGQKLHLKLQETVFHPGHYRVALAVNSRAELPEDSPVTTRDSARGPQSVSASIDKQPKMPVLADGLFPHTQRMNDPWETDIDIPNISCPKCTLQIVEFMAEHGLNKD